MFLNSEGTEIEIPHFDSPVDRFTIQTDETGGSGDAATSELQAVDEVLTDKTILVKDEGFFRGGWFSISTQTWIHLSSWWVE